MLNNTAGDPSPYLLTAHHCVPDQAAARSLVAYWNYQTATCGGAPDGSLSRSLRGAELLVSAPAQDLALLRLDQAPDPAWGPHYAGWDRSGDIPLSGASIHHPAGQEKRISATTAPLSPTAAFQSELRTDGDFLMVSRWDWGVTEGGSSGAPFFDAQQRVVGALSGGYSVCGQNLPDWYGRLSAAWGQGFAPYLDPLGTGALRLDGKTLTPVPAMQPAPATPAPAAEATPSTAGGGALSLGLLLGLAPISRYRIGRRRGPANLRW